MVDGGWRLVGEWGFVGGWVLLGGGVRTLWWLKGADSCDNDEELWEEFCSNKIKI